MHIPPLQLLNQVIIATQVGMLCQWQLSKHCTFDIPAISYNKITATLSCVVRVTLVPHTWKSWNDKDLWKIYDVCMKIQWSWTNFLWRSTCGNNYQINGTRTTNLSNSKHITTARNSLLAAGNAKAKGKAIPLHRPGQGLRAPWISTKLAYKGGKVHSPMSQLPYP
jgi:hypothetical protein